MLPKHFNLFCLCCEWVWECVSACPRTLTRPTHTLTYSNLFTRRLLTSLSLSLSAIFTNARTLQAKGLFVRAPYIPLRSKIFKIDFFPTCEKSLCTVSHSNGRGWWRYAALFRLRIKDLSELWPNLWKSVIVLRNSSHRQMCFWITLCCINCMS